VAEQDQVGTQRSSRIRPSRTRALTEHGDGGGDDLGFGVAPPWQAARLDTRPDQCLTDRWPVLAGVAVPHDPGVVTGPNGQAAMFAARWAPGTDAPVAVGLGLGEAPLDVPVEALWRREVAAHQAAASSAPWSARRRAGRPVSLPGRRVGIDDLRSSF
jgi:hypothetical protein